MVVVREGEAGVEERDGEKEEEGGGSGAGAGAVAGTAAGSLAEVSGEHSVGHFLFEDDATSEIRFATEVWKKIEHFSS